MGLTDTTSSTVQELLPQLARAWSRVRDADSAGHNAVDSLLLQLEEAVAREKRTPIPFDYFRVRGVKAERKKWIAHVDELEAAHVENVRAAQDAALERAAKEADGSAAEEYGLKGTIHEQRASIAARIASDIRRLKTAPQDQAPRPNCAACGEDFDPGNHICKGEKP